MGSKLLSVSVHGKEREWSFNFYGDPAYLKDWRADGLDVVEIQNVIPGWVVDLGLLRPFVFLQDLLNFKNPLKKD